MLKKSNARTSAETDLKTAAIAAIHLARILLEVQARPSKVTHAHHMDEAFKALDNALDLARRATVENETLPLSLRLQE
jgi:hypothetical protein